MRSVLSGEGPSPVRAKSYRIYQTLPPQHWYQRRIGWFGKTLVSVFMMVAIGSAVFGYNLTQEKVKTYAAESSQDEQLHKVTTAKLDEPAAENIVELQSVLDTWVTQHPGQQWGVTVKSLDGPSFDASVNSNKEFRSASLYKLLITLPLFKKIPLEHQQGIQLNVNNAHRSVATCVDLMLRVSNNECGEAVADYLGWGDAEKILRQAGYNHTDLNGDAPRTSAGDVGQFLSELYGDAFNRPTRESIMTSLKQQRWRQGIPSGCPGCSVANKTGNIDNVTHDAAIVEYKGGAYVLVIMSENGTFDQIAQLTGRIQQRIVDVTQ